ncbi:MAG: translocation/assembly module TamB domain-containing protein [Sediminibacterium sp.]|nr:translocation/assembly module TamB domain-containing protein [Sediminibacterium sp.]
MPIFATQTKDLLKRFFTILRRTVLVIIAIILLVFIAIQTDFVQNRLVKIATSRLSNALGTEVSIQSVSFSLFNRFNLEGTMVRDKQKDTLLYAGQLKVRITDWFFLKKKATLHFVGMEDAVVKLQRKDSTWNYGFLVDYFTSPGTSRKKNGFALNLKKVDVKNLRFQKNDLWVGEKMNITVASLVVDAENIDLVKNAFFINRISLDKPFISIQDIPGLRPKILRNKKAGADTGMYFNVGDISVLAGNISIRNGSLFIDGNLNKPLPFFDGSHIQLSKLNGSISGLRFIKDTLRAIVHISAKDRCGLEIKKLKTDFRLTPQIMELSKLDLQTNKSRLTDYYAMQFKDFNNDFADYITRVTMNAVFKESKVSSDDIAFFAPELSSWKRTFIVSGHYLGTVDNFTVTHLSAGSGAETQMNGLLRMKGLPDINRTNISLTNGTLQTNYYDLGVLIPVLKGVNSPNLAALGKIIYRGNFNGTFQNFVTAGIFSTQLGGIKTNISLHLPEKGEPSYTGDIETSRFNMGKFLNDTLLGLVDFKGKITGSNFTIDKLKTTLEGKISSLTYNNYTYSDIVTNGTFQKKYFKGEVKINDPNLDFTSTVEIDLTKDLPRFNILGDLVHSNLYSLNLLKNSTDSLELTGLLDVNFTGTNIDNFLGTAKFLNATIKSGATKLSFDSLNLVSSYEDSIKSLHLGSNDFDATVLGKFSILGLPSSFQSFLSHYYPSYIKRLKSIPKNQQFSFSVNTGNIEPYLKIIDKKIAGFNYAKITGSVDTRLNQLGILAEIPSGKYDNSSFTGLDLQGKGNLDTLSLTGNISSIQVSDSLRFPNTILVITSNQDHSVVSIKTSANNTFTEADLYADVYTLTDGVKIQFRPSSFVLNEKKWIIEKSGEITVRTNLAQAKNVKFTQSFQEIAIETVPGNISKTSDLVVKLKNVVMGDITGIFFKDPRLEAVTSGSIALNDLMGNFQASANLKAEQFRMDDDSIGLVNIKAGYDSKSGEITYTVQSPNDDYRFSATGRYQVKDTSGKSFHTEIDLANSRIDILHKFLSNLFTDLTGRATGLLTISGNLNAPDLFGKIKLRNAGMKVNYSQVYYTIDSADINFTEEGIDFGTFHIRDRYKNIGTVRGRLLEKGFKHMTFDFDLTTHKLLLIDTKATDNQQFYGKAIGNATLTLKGPESNARMSIIAESNDSSHIYIPNSVSRESGVADFIEFKQYGTEMEREGSNSNFNLNVDLDITANNQMMIDVILDDLTGDVIKAVGNGKLKINVGTKEPLTMWGRYNIERGSYVFNFQGLIRKPFELLPDAGNYIEWKGDPFRADLHIDARYTAERISLSDLVSNLNLSPAVKGYRGDVYVIAMLRDKLNKPDIKFKLDFPQGSPVKSDNEFTQYINRLEKDQNEILNQVAFLILFNAFAPPGGGNNSSGITPYSITSLTVNTVSKLLTKSVNKVLSNLLYKITGDKSLRFDVGTSVYSSSNLLDPGSNKIDASNGKLDRTRVDLKFGYAFANDKIIITLGSDIDFNFGNSSAIQNGNTQWLPNVNIEIVLSKDKKLRLIIFNKNSLDFSGSSFGRRNRQGVSISYRKDFESLFAKKEKEIEFNGPVDSTQNKEN